MITLKNPSASVLIAERGAELKSFKVKDTEYIWQGHADVWPASCPLMFPVCGGLKEDQYTYRGETYSMPKHGFGRFKTFRAEQISDTKAVFTLTEDEDSLKMYPFRYELKITYQLEETALRIEYNVRNDSDRTMYFAIGSHEGYAAPEGVEDYDVIFPEKETISARLTCGNILSDQYVPLLKDANTLPMYDKFFTVDALVIQDLKSRSATMRNRRTGRAIRVDFPGTDTFVLWHKHSAGFLCMEPWTGYHDTPSCSGELQEKEGMVALRPGEESRKEHTITVLE